MNHIPPFYLPSKCRAIKNCYDQATTKNYNEPVIIQEPNVKTPIHEHTSLIRKDDQLFSKTKRDDFDIIIKGLKLVGSTLIIPNVEAATPNEPPSNSSQTPEKPPLMKYKDLSLYDSPHYEYNQYMKDRDKCKEYKTRTVYLKLYPHVKNTRAAIFDFVSVCYTEVKNQVNYAAEQSKIKKDNFVVQARCPDNLLLRQVAVATSVIIGFVLGRRLSRFKDSLIRGLLGASGGALAAGALCFPEETDEYFRECCHKAAELGLEFYNVYANDNKTMKKTLPCISSLPSSPCMPEKEREEIKRFR